MNKYTGYIEVSAGMIKIVCSEEHVLSVSFSDTSKENDKGSKVLDEALKQMNEYFSGKRKTFDLPLYFEGTEFQKSVWNELRKIPYGITVSYKDIAEGINNEKAVRAVGNANNKNKIMIIVPCHRVIGKNGKLVGFAGGLDKKEFLLEHEKKFL
ncbi:methylated-DNA--[protein]-cysteine S-methyltransferase [Sebaldella sp. S0638]|uniref:methylated-DNA--[protein]-cysteine S-methyltransferase n=1 Tax=Sebaldella sp. S0638 TaxID=2957809 RepID=UPI0020A0C16F|nr:methylated-DNA--[protein]-cysteine S-methyltransferase [Sebaldella sp. S0638]MCP1223829.1 methylated-DNA--[protein]-cysteine S-methyltransferase [Sebaldella sp. S0638]